MKMSLLRILDKNDIQIRQRNTLHQKEAIDLMVSLVRLTQIQKRSGEVSITLYRRQNCRVNGMSIGTPDSFFIELIPPPFQCFFIW